MPFDARVEEIVAESNSSGRIRTCGGACCHSFHSTNDSRNARPGFESKKPDNAKRTPGSFVSRKSPPWSPFGRKSSESMITLYPWPSRHTLVSNAFLPSLDSECKAGFPNNLQQLSANSWREASSSDRHRRNDSK